jgi:hypothetical protein
MAEKHDPIEASRFAGSETEQAVAHRGVQNQKWQDGRRHPEPRCPEEARSPVPTARQLQERLCQDDPRRVVRKDAERELSALRRLAPDVTMAPPAAQ